MGKIKGGFVSSIIFPDIRQINVEITFNVDEDHYVTCNIKTLDKKEYELYLRVRILGDDLITEIEQSEDIWVDLNEVEVWRAMFWQK